MFSEINTRRVVSTQWPMAVTTLDNTTRSKYKYLASISLYLTLQSFSVIFSVMLKLYTNIYHHFYKKSMRKKFNGITNTVYI